MRLLESKHPDEVTFQLMHFKRMLMTDVTSDDPDMPGFHNIVEIVDAEPKLELFEILGSTIVSREVIAKGIICGDIKSPDDFLAKTALIQKEVGQRKLEGQALTVFQPITNQTVPRPRAVSLSFDHDLNQTIRQEQADAAEILEVEWNVGQPHLSFTMKYNHKHRWLLPLVQATALPIPVELNEATQSPTSVYLKRRTEHEIRFSELLIEQFGDVALQSPQH